ncbi:HNH/ENDO VII family nuclease, partial [Corynebacterium diphtheriae]
MAPLDPSTNTAFELHHIGQINDAPLAILTVQEHRSSETMKILHRDLKSSEVEHGREWLLRKHA